MDKEFAQYLTVLIANDLAPIRDVSSNALENIENCFINGDFKEIEHYIYNFKRDNRSVLDIIKECEQNER